MLVPASSASLHTKVRRDRRVQRPKWTSLGLTAFVSGARSPVRLTALSPCTVIVMTLITRCKVPILVVCSALHCIVFYVCLPFSLKAKGQSTRVTSDSQESVTPGSVRLSLPQPCCILNFTLLFLPFPVRHSVGGYLFSSSLSCHVAS